MNIFNMVFNPIGAATNVGKLFGEAIISKPISTVASQSPALNTTPSTVLSTYDKSGSIISDVLSTPRKITLTNPFGVIIENVKGIFSPITSPKNTSNTVAVVESSKNIPTLTRNTFGKISEMITLGKNIFDGASIESNAPEVNYYPTSTLLFAKPSNVAKAYKTSLTASDNTTSNKIQQEVNPSDTTGMALISSGTLFIIIPIACLLLFLIYRKK